MLLYILILYIVLACFAWFFSEKLIFPLPPVSYTENADIIKIPTRDNRVIIASYLKNPEAKYTVIISHGNYEDIYARQSYLKAWQSHGYNVLIYDYAGYGLSKGKPSEKIVYLDCLAAYDYLTKTLSVPPQKIIAYGHSIGAAVAINLALHQPLAALIVEGAFVSAYRVVTTIPILPFDKFDNLGKVKHITVPKLFIHGQQDEVVPFWHGKKLFDAALPPKQNYWVANAHHNDLFWVAGEENYFAVIDNFVATLTETGKH